MFESQLVEVVDLSLDITGSGKKNKKPVQSSDESKECDDSDQKGNKLI
jgi:hypothetical protein